MVLRFDGGEVRAAAGLLDGTARELVELRRRCDEVAGHIADRQVSAGLLALAGACGDAFELVALDLTLLETKVMAGATVLDVTERGLVATMTPADQLAAAVPAARAR